MLDEETVSSDGDDPAVLADLTKRLREQKKRDPGKLVAAIARSSFEKHGGRALAWALVRMFSVANPKYTHGLLRQGRGLLSHLVGKPGVRKAQIEGTGIVEGSLEATGATGARLADAVTAWIEGECPTGSQFRRNKAHQILRGFKTPAAFGLRIEGRFGMARREDPTDRNCPTTRSFRGAKITWSLPWQSRMDGW
ncbi:MAG: hypothetical protein GY704_07820, partial [Phycisphaeraceae bacterium]|nr:hypothetical protein [Phycisphaeraceae bacterium]